MNMQAKYEGQLYMSSTHLNSGQVIHTTAPTDNGGLGDRFSPTDLVVSALGCCCITLMAKSLGEEEHLLTGSYVNLSKEMNPSPRRIAKMILAFHLPSHLTQETRHQLEQVIHTCPVRQSLHPDIVLDLQYNYDL